MSLAIGDDHLALLDAVRRFTAGRCDQKVVRTAVDAEEESLPPFWDELVGLGWLDVHADGYGFAEVAVVIEELARVLAPGPVLPTMWAAALLGAPCDGPAAVALAPGTPVLGGQLAETLVVPVEREGTQQWGMVHREGFTATPVESLDPTRRMATVDVDEASVELLPGLTGDDVREAAAVLFAAECAGGAAWCVETASSYAKVREQFGRPIGKFQAVKHKCADMLVAVEQARSAAWDAARALDGEADAALATAVAGAVAPEAFASVAKDCIQVLGGIGFTWEHDAHLYLRRAIAVRQLLGGPSPWRRAVASSALAGKRRRLTVDLPPEAEAVRTEVRAFAEGIGGLNREERRARLVDAGYLVPHWPTPWGRGADAVEQLVIEEELRRAGIRTPNLAVGAWAAPTIAAHGTPEQQERWVRPTLLGTVKWCQLFSEPGAGSDLASLRTTATRTDRGWLLNGQKVWTSLARDADWGICLVRTNPSAPKHLGITYVIVDMKAAGIDIRPLRELTGMEMFNEVFLDDVFVPDDCVIGEVDGGWPLARTTLGNERVAMGSGSSFGGGIESLLTLVNGMGSAAELDPLVLDQVGALVAEAHTVAVLGLRSTERSVAGGGPGPEASVRKLLGVEHDQRTQEVGLSLLGADGATTAGVAAQWTFGFLANRCLTIAGGTSEIQRNVIAERLLGLPRDD